MMVKNFTTYKPDPNEWVNLADDPVFESKKEELRRVAPKGVCKPIEDLNARKSLVIEGRYLSLGTREGQLCATSQISSYHKREG